MKISIITIVYNDVSNIRKTIESVLSQSYDNIQYVCIDGGSTDGTVDIINEYLDKISFFISEPDRGIADAFNKGIKVADGDYVLVLNSGDTYIGSDSINTLVEAIKNNGDVCYNIYSCDSVLVNGDNKIKIFKSEPKKLKYRMSVSHNGLAISRDVYNTLCGYDVNYKIAMDYDFMIRYLKRFTLATICRLPLCLTTYELGGVSDTRSTLGFYESYRTKSTNGHGTIHSFIYFLLLSINHVISSLKR